MASCATGLCGRKDLDEPAPGLEEWNGKWSCTLCYVNPIKFPQRSFKLRRKVVEQPEQLAGPAQPKEKEFDLYGERE